MLWLVVVIMQYFQASKAQTSSPQALSEHSFLGKIGVYLPAFMLFVYAAGFSYAYIELDTGVGALILFGCVQLTMIMVSIFNREQLKWQQWLGLVLAFAGLVFLVHSQSNLGEAKVSILGFALMILSGVAWGIYTLLGRGSVQPTIDTRTNFLLSVPFCICLLAVYIYMPIELSYEGFLLALASGALTSGLGYAIWYFALAGLSRIQAGVVQLLVPVIAAIGGVIWANESLPMSLVVSQLVILGGIAMVMFTKTKPNIVR